MFSIIYEPVHGIMYKNSKKEKRVMRHSEIHNFCDATLNRVLEGLRSYNNNVKYGYIQRDLTNEEVEYLKLFEEEIEDLTMSKPFEVEIVEAPLALLLSNLDLLELESLSWVPFERENRQISSSDNLCDLFSSAY
ncbi:hypothetical protein Tco_0761515 [Tanacetum coccineum]